MEMAVIDDGSLHTIEESPGMSKEEMFDDTSEIKKQPITHVELFKEDMHVQQ